MKDKIVIATRESLLALWQAEYVKKRIEDTYPEIQVELLPVTTKGDQILDRSLLEIGEKGLFIKELENLLLEKKADIAVHFEGHDCCNSRWIETGGSDGERGSAGRFLYLWNMAVCRSAGRGGRGDIQSPPTGAAAPFTAGSADKTLRGNVQTRLRHLDEGNYDADPCGGRIETAWTARTDPILYFYL